MPADREIEKRMDLHNNQIGMNLAVPTWPTAADISQAAYNAVAIGFCWYIRPLNSDWSLRTDSELHSTNE